MNEISEYDIKNREKYLQKAKSAESFQDAVFYVHYYNNHIKRRWKPAPRPEDITPGDVFSTYEERDYNQVLDKSVGLLSVAYVGAAFFEYDNSEETYEQAVMRMKSEFAGFSEDVYGLVCTKSITGMR